MSDTIRRSAATSYDEFKRNHPDLIATAEAELEVTEEIARLTAEVKRLEEQLRLTQLDWNIIADENASLRKLVDDACAVVRLPGTDNDGGPGDLAEEFRILLHNSNVWADEAIAATAEVEKMKAVVAAARRYVGGGKYHERIEARNDLEDALRALDGEP